MIGSGFSKEIYEWVWFSIILNIWMGVFWKSQRYVCTLKYRKRVVMCVVWEMGRSFRWDRKNGRPVSQQVRQDKITPCSKAPNAEHRPKFCSSVTSPYDYLLFYIPLKNFSFIGRIHHYQFRPMFGAQGLWAGRNLYRATPAVTRGLGSEGLSHSFASCDTQPEVEDLF
jgi:hypothetical protein